MQFRCTLVSSAKVSSSPRFIGSGSVLALLDLASICIATRMSTVLSGTLELLGVHTMHTREACLGLLHLSP